MTHRPALTGPLYLQNGSAQRLDLDARRRLCIERQGHPKRFIPLQFISRIVCSSTLDISSRALMASMASGIPICIVNPDGSALGWCMGSRRKETTLRQLLTHALDDPQWPALYQPWLALQHRALAAHTLLLCGVPSTAAARANPRAALCNAHFLQHRQGCAIHVNALGALARHELATHLAADTGEPSLLAWYQPGINLLQDLGELLALHAHIDLHHAAELPTADQVTAWAVRQYERHSAHWQHRVAHLMHAFAQFLRQHWL